MSLTLRGEIGRRLTIAEMDNNFIYLESISGSNTVVTISATQAIDIAANNQITPNVTYYIKGVHNDDVYPQLYGGTDILVTGLTTSQFSTNGYGKFYNPNYASYSMWNSQTEYEEGNEVIYGGKVWISKGHPNPSDNIDFFNLNSDNWDVQGYTSSYYKEVWDEIEYDIKYNWICSRYDALNNNLVKVNLESSTWFYCGVSPIRMFRWGHSLNDGGVSGCTIENSYFGCLNYIDGNIIGVKLNNFSYIYNLNLDDGSTFGPVELSNNSTINNIYLYNTDFEYATLTNRSEISGIYMTNSYISYLNLNNGDLDDIYCDNDGNMRRINIDDSSITHITNNNSGYFNYIDISGDSNIDYINMEDYSNIENVNISNSSSLYDISLSDESYVENINMENGSDLYQMQLIDSNMEDITLVNNSNIESSYFDDSGVYNLSLDGSGLYNLYFTNSSIYSMHLVHSYIENILSNNLYMEFIYLKDAVFTGLQLVDNIIQLDMKGSELSFNPDEERIIPFYTDFNTNTLKYQFSFNFSGSDGFGATGSELDYFNKLLVPSGFYIEKITLDTTSITTTGEGPAKINIGIAGLSPSYAGGINNQDLITDSVKVYDISNGLCYAGKAGTNTVLFAEITDFSVTSGNMNVEIIIKNTNYGHNND